MTDYGNDMRNEIEVHHEKNEVTTSNGAGKRKNSSRLQSYKYALPTPDEALQLLGIDAGASDMIGTKSLQLEVEELLGEVRVNYERKTVKDLEAWLFTLKEILENMPPEIVRYESLPSKFIRLSNYSLTRSSLIDFSSPSSFNIVGSYMLKSVVKPSLNIDMAIEIPSSCFLSRDYLNHRYFDKRALYIGYLGKKLCTMVQSGQFIAKSIKISYFKGDPRKPCLLIVPFESSALRNTFTVRLLPCVDANTIPLSKLSIIRSNCRRRRVRTDNTPPPPTPHYNHAIIEDMAYKRHMTALHAASAESDSFRDATMIVKVWLGQRGHRTVSDSMDSYSSSMLLLYLLQAKIVNVHMAALQLFQALIKFVASGNLRAKSGKNGQCRIVRCSESDPHKLSSSDNENFSHAFPAVLVDSGLNFNIFARISLNALIELEIDAKNSLSILQDARKCSRILSFSHLFLTRASFWRRYDMFVTLRFQQDSLQVTKSSESPEDEARKNTEEDILLDKNECIFVAEKNAELLLKALGNRATVIRALLGSSSEDANDFIGVPGAFNAAEELLNNNSSVNKNNELTVTFGLLLDAAYTNRGVDRGPSAENSELANEFRQFWGEKSELRRFKDGAIVEAVVWDGKSMSIVEKIVRYILGRHDPDRCSLKNSVEIIGPSDAYRLISCTDFATNESSTLSLNKYGISIPEGDESLTRYAVQSADQLSTVLKSLNGLPIRIDTVIPNCPELRFSSIFPPIPHPLAAISPLKITPKWNYFLGKNVTSVVQPLHMVLQFEDSSKWPKHIEAILQTNAAFLLKISQSLKDEYSVASDVVVKDENTCEDSALDVFLNGYCFRIQIWNKRENDALKERFAQGDTRSKKLAEKQYLNLVTSPLHHSFISGFHASHRNFGPTLRLCILWLNSHMLSDQIPFEAVELIVVSILTQTTPCSAPNGAFSGLLRFLIFLGNFDFSNFPLIINFHNEISSKDYDDIMEEFESARALNGAGDAKFPCSMYIIAPYDRANNWVPSWTRSVPISPILGRIRGLALSATASMLNWVQKMKPNANDLHGLFLFHKEESVGFGGRIRLNPDLCSEGAIFGEKSFVHHMIQGHKAFQVQISKQNSNIQLKAGFDPIRDLLAEIRRRFGQFAIFLFDSVNGNSIAIVWKPACFLPFEYSAFNSRYAIPISESGGSDAVMLLPNIPQMMTEIRTLGGDLIKEVIPYWS